MGYCDGGGMDRANISGRGWCCPSRAGESLELLSVERSSTSGSTWGYCCIVVTVGGIARRGWRERFSVWQSAYQRPKHRHG